MQQAQVRVIVSVRLDVESPDSSLATPAGLQQRREAVAAAQDHVLDALAGLAVTQLRRFEFTPGMAMTVGVLAIDRLDALPSVIAIKEDALVEPMLDVSVPLVQADRVVQLGTTGDNIAIAILDSGVDKTHPDLAGPVVSEACFSSRQQLDRLFLDVPWSRGVVASRPQGEARTVRRTCSGSNRVTRVASIAAAVAPQADIIAIQVFTWRDDGLLKPCEEADKGRPCMTSFESDEIAGLDPRCRAEWRADNRCGDPEPRRRCLRRPCNASFTSMRDTVALLRALGIAVVVSAGNDGFRNLMSGPACLSNVISVGATNDF